MSLQWSLLGVTPHYRCLPAQDYKELSAIQRLKYAEKRQTSIMGKILKQHTPAGARPVI